MQVPMTRLPYAQEAFRTERAQRAGLANAASGRIMVTCAGDHFGPILAEHDPDQGRVRGLCQALVIGCVPSILAATHAQDEEIAQFCGQHEQGRTAGAEPRGSLWTVLQE